MEYMACEYCSCKGIRVGFRGVAECCGCGHPSRSAPVSSSFEDAMKEASRNLIELQEAIGGKFTGVTCSGHTMPIYLVPQGERIENGNLTREGHRS